MQFRLSLAVTLVWTQCVVSAANSFSLYAYGDNLPTGMKLFHADGQAYIGHKAPSFATEAANITLVLTDDSRFVASPEGNVQWTSQPSMYIGTDAGDTKTVGFVSEDNISKDTIVTGFGLFGGWAYNNQNSGAIEMNFIATPANEPGLYQVKWNGESTKILENHVPISLRTEAPATPQN